MDLTNRNVGNFSASAQEDEFDIWGFLKRRKFLILLLMMIGVGSAWLLFERQEPIYRTSALVQIIQKNIGEGGISSALDRNLKDASLVITSPGLLESAIERHSLGKLSMLQGLSPEVASDRVAEMTDVTTEFEKTTVIEVAVDGTVAAELPVIANAIAEEYVKTQMENYKDARGELVTLLLSTRDDLHKELKQKEQEYSEFREQTGLLSDGANPHRERHRSYWARLATVTTEETVLKAELATLEKAVQSGDSRDAMLLAIGKLTERPAARIEGEETDRWVRSMEERLVPLVLEEQTLNGEIGPGHPKLISIRRQIELTRAVIDQHVAKKTATPTPKVSTDFVAAYVQSLKQKIETNATAREHLQILTNEAEELARSLAGEENEDRSRRNEIARLTRLFDDTSKQVSELQIGTEVDAIKAQILVPARIGKLVFPIFIKFMGIGAILGGMLGVGLGYLVEMADRSFRKPEDIMREFGIPIVGHIPEVAEKQLGPEKGQNELDRMAVCVHAPRSRAAEAFRSVRTAVCFSIAGSEHRVIQITSPTAGDGKSTLALNLSISLALSGKRTILVESDFRRPRVHKFTGTENQVGIVDVLRGQAELVDAVQTVDIDGLYVMPCGSRPKDPAELLSRPEYENLLEVLREEYDYVIVDTPPVLVVTDAAAVASRVDSVILTMRLSRHDRAAGLKTLEQLREMGTTIAGIVINGVEESDGYGSYHYSGYQYRNSDYDYRDRTRDYFTDDQADKTETALLKHIESK